MTSVKIRHHPNLVTLIGIAEYQNEYYIINEFCNGVNNLFDLGNIVWFFTRKWAQYINGSEVIDC